MRVLSGFLTVFLLGSTAQALAAPAKPMPEKPAKTMATPAPAKIEPLPDTPEVAALRRSFRFAFPIYEVLRTRAGQLGKASELGLANAVNIILPRTTLADAATRDVTTPNNDTLYGSAWLDLAAGPVILTVPALPGRYHSAALMSLKTENIAIVGTRTGSQEGRFAIVGPNYTGPTPDGTTLMRSDGNDAWLLVRVLVEGPQDLEAAAKSLGGFRLEVPEGRAPAEPMVAPAPANPNATTFLAAVSEVLARSAGSPLAARGSDAGLAADTDDQKTLWNQSLPALLAELKSGLADAGEVVNGWSYPRMGIGESGGDDDLRALVAQAGLGALPRAEAMYLSARTDSVGIALDGSQAYTVALPPRLPVGAFWSLTMYQVEPDGRLFFVPNDLDRFAIGDRSPQIRANRDGSYDIFVQTTPPSGERVVNWLPAPKGKFVLVFRAYLPKPELLDGSFRLPPVAVTERIE